MKTLLRAAWVAPMNGPPIRDAALVIEDGRVVAVGRDADLRRGHPDVAVIELGDAIIVPGLVNAHTHLELTSVGQLPAPASLVDWILALRDRMTGVGEVEAFVRASTQEGVRQCLRFGVTAVGDVTLNPAVTRPILGHAKLGGVSYGEVLGMAGRVAQMQGRIAAAIQPTLSAGGPRIGIEPHAPYSLDLNGYERCLALARERELPLATHLAETPDEAAFLADHSGEFRRLWAALGDWRDDVTRADGGPIRAMSRMGLLAYPALLAHVNYADDEELSLLAAGRASVVYCPRTHAYFRHPPHRFAEMLDRGINVAIGTDSVASSGDLNLLADLRLAHRRRPELSAESLWKLVTVNGAAALRDDSIGQLKPGSRADFGVFDVTGDAPLLELLEEDRLPRETWVTGDRVHAAAP